MTALLVVLGAAVGAPLRHAVGLLLNGRFPWGTFAVNVVGSFVLGAVLGAAASSEVVALVGTGFCGALTTYSTFGHETVQLGERGRPRLAALYVAGSVLAGLGAAGAGLLLGALLSGWPA